MKQTKAQKAAERLVSGIDPDEVCSVDRRLLTDGIAAAIEKATKAERRACAGIADSIGYDAANLGNEFGAGAETASTKCARLIRARGRK